MSSATSVHRELVGSLTAYELKKVRKSLAKMELSGLAVDTSLFLFENWMRIKYQFDECRELTAQEKQPGALTAQCKTARSCLKTLADVGLVSFSGTGSYLSSMGNAMRIVPEIRSTLLGSSNSGSLRDDSPYAVSLERAKKTATQTGENTLRSTVFSTLAALLLGNEKIHPGFEQVKKLNPQDKDQFLAIVSSMNIDYVTIEQEKGKSVVLAFKLLLGMPELMALRTATIITYEIAQSSEPVRSLLPMRDPNQTIHQAFTEELFRWILDQTDVSPEKFFQLLSLWQCVQEKKAVDPVRWNVHPGLTPFAEAYKCYPHLLLENFSFVELGWTSRVAGKSLTSSQTLQAFALWKNQFASILREINLMRDNLSAFAEGRFAASYAAAFQHKHKQSGISRVTLSKHKFKKMVNQQFQPEEHRQFIRDAGQLNHLMDRRLQWVSEEVALLQKSPRPQRLVEMLLASTFESVFTPLEKLKKFMRNMGKEADLMLSNSSMSSGERTFFQMEKQDVINFLTSIESFEAFSRQLIDLMHQEETPVASTATGAKDQKTPATATAEPAPKMVSRQTFRRRLAYETLALTDLIDIDEIAPPAEPKAPPLKKASPAKTAAVPKAESVAAMPSVTLPPPAVSESLTKELDLQLGAIERAVTEISRWPLVGSASPFVLALTQALYPINRTAEAQEAADHLFLATQSLEVIAECLMRKKPELLAAAYRAFLLDTAITLEQTLKVKHPSLEHNLLKLADNSGLQLTSAQYAFLDQFQQATLWARYPAASAAFFGNDALPTPLRTLNQLLDTVPRTFLSELFSTYRQMLSIAVSPELMKTPSVQKFLTHLAQLEKALIVPDEKPFPTKISPLHTQRTSIQQALAHAHYAPMQDDDPIVPLQEISHYLAWIAQGQELQRMLHTPQLRFWHQRNLLDVEKLFKHLYTADALLHDLGAIRRHSLSVFAGALDGIRNLKPHLALLRSINFQIGHHYHTRAPLPAYPALLRDCQAVTQGFSVGEKEEERVFPDVEKALKLFAEQLPFTLDKLRRVEEELAREARQVVVKG